MVEGILGSGEVVRFGSFALNLQTGELRKHGVRVRLQGKPFQILRALLERPGHVVTRDELRERLWSSDTFVDFESGLNTAMNRLRITLGDSAESPIYVETIARHGYRFVAPVEHAMEPAEQVRNGAADPVHVEASVIGAGTSTGAAWGRTGKTARTYWAVGLLLLLLVATGLIAFYADRSSARQLSFHQLTFQKGFATGARFARDGKSVVYSAGWNGAPNHVFLAGAMSPQSRELGSAEAWFAGFPSGQEIGFFTMSEDRGKWLLEAETLSGASPHVLSERARQADWASDGRLAIVTLDDSNYSIEYPAGQMIYRSTARINNLRVSPAGDRIAFLEHPVPLDDAGRVMEIDVASRQARALSSGWGSVEGLAWNPSGKEVWFTAARSGIERSLMAVTLGGHLRTVAQMPGGMVLRDIDRSGRVLIDRSTQHMSMMLGSVDGGAQHDISWLDWSRAVAISGDGKSVLFDETGAGGGASYSVFIEQIGSDTPKHIGEGRAMDLSADGQWALAQDAHDATRLMLLSADGATHQSVGGGGIAYQWLKFLPGGRDILFSGAYPKQSPHLYKQHLPDGPVVLVSPEAPPDSVVISPDGQLAVTDEDNGHITVLDLRQHRKRTITVTKAASPIRFSEDGEVLTSRVQGRNLVFELLDLSNGELTPYKRIEMPDATGIIDNLPMYVSGDLHSYVYSRLQNLSTLFVVTGWK